MQKVILTITAVFIVVAIALFSASRGAGHGRSGALQSASEPAAIAAPVAEAMLARSPTEAISAPVTMPSDEPRAASLRVRTSLLPPRHSVSAIDDGSRPLVDVFDALVAEGSGSAAARLMQEVQLCSVLPRTDEQLARQKEANREYYVAGGAEDLGPLEDSFAFLDHSLRRCRGITPEHMQRTLEFLGETGAADWLNALQYATRVYDKSPVEAEAVAQRVWQETGSAAALGLLGRMSLAPRIAGLLFTMNAFGPQPAGTHNELIANARDALEQLQNETPIPTYNAAFKEALQILASPECCQP